MNDDPPKDFVDEGNDLQKKCSGCVNREAIIMQLKKELKAHKELIESLCAGRL
jgi:hypothetical protein